MKLALALASIGLFGLSNAANTYVATWTGTVTVDLSNEGITGTVTVDNGHVTVDLDLSTQPSSLPDGYSTCTSGGMEYHIHKMWEHDTETGLIGSTLCGSTYTGGHWDPWHGCGSASGNEYCDMYADCIPSSEYSVDWENDAFSAEVGDWNGKYGLLEPDSDDMIYAFDGSFYEVTPDDMATGNYSVVFYCNDGQRAFCAPFNESSTATSQTIPSQDTFYSSVKADFDLLTEGSEIILYANGDVHVELDWTDLEDDTGCDTFYYGVFNPSDTAMSSSAAGSDCADYIDSFYDPTHQCMDFSGSEYCYGSSKLCNATGYSYDCEFDHVRYSCAPGDLSGKFGDITASAKSFFESKRGPGTLIPPTYDLVDLIAAVYCGDNYDGITYLACAPFAVSGVVAQSVVVAVVASLFAMLF